MESPTLEEALDTPETVDDADPGPVDPEPGPNAKSEEAGADEDEDWDVEMDLGKTGGAKAIPSPPINASSAAWHASMSAATSAFTGTITRLGAGPKSDVEECWDEFDIDLNSSEETPTVGSTLVPHTKIAADLSDWDDDDDDEAISIIKVASGQLSFPSVPTSSTPPRKAQPIPDDEDFEQDFSLPDDLAHLSLRPLRHRSSKTNLDGWGDQTSSSTAYSSEASSFGVGTNESPSSNSVSLYSQGAETDDDDDESLLGGLILPEGLFGTDENDGKLLHKLIEKRKQQAATEIVAVASPHEEDDFESGLVIDDDVDFNLSKAIKHRHSSSASRSLKGLSMQASPRLQPAEENPAPSGSQSLTNSPETPRDPVHEYKSPLSRSFASVARAASPRPSGASSPAPSRPPLRESRASFHGASRPIISPPSSFSSLSRDPLRRQSSAGKLQTSLSIIDVHTAPSPTGDSLRVTLKRPSPNSEAVSPQFTRRIPPAPVSSPIGRYNSARSRSMNSPLSPATMMSLSSSASRLQQSPHLVPPTPPGTPSSNPIALRLTTSTSSSRAKSRPALTSIFPGASMSSSGSQGVPRPTSFAAAVKSPVRSPLSTPSTPQTPKASTSSSPIRHRATPMSRSSTVSAVAASVPQPLQAKILKRPKRLRIYGDGTELDGIEDLPTDKDRVLRRNSGATKPEEGDSTGARFSRRRADLTSNRASVSSSATATPSLGQLPLSPMNSPKTEKRRSINSLPLKRRPMLIRNLNGVGAPKVVGQMRWNPQTLRWEGNDQELRAFENAIGSSTRPALITKLSGAALGSPVQSGSGMDGARVVGNMLFDPVEMRWVSQLPPEEEEPDVFADLADDEEEDLGSWSKNKGGTIRATGGLLASIRVAPASPDRSTSDGVNTSQNNIMLLTSPLSDGNPSPARSSYSRGESEMDISVDGASSDGGDGITQTFIDDTMQAEARHRTEMVGWLVDSIQEDASNANLSPEAVPFPARSPVQEVGRYDRAYLYDLRAIAIRSKASSA